MCELQVERGFLDAFWIRGWKCIKLTGTSRSSNIATSPCSDVLTSRRRVNKCRSQQAATPRRLNVATLQRRDVSAIFASPSVKAKRGPEFEDRRSYELGHGNQSSSDLDLEEEPAFCIFLLF